MRELNFTQSVPDYLGKPQPFKFRIAKFESYDEYLAYASQNPHGSPSGYTKGFHECKTWAEAYTLAKDGWTAGANRISAVVKKLDVASRVKRPEITFDVIGDGGIDMGRLISGEPECMMDWRESEVDANNPTGDFIRIVVNISASATVKSDILLQRGAAVIALIDALEQAGKRVEVYMVDPATGNGKFISQFIKLKTLDYSISPAMLAFAIGHPDSMRRVSFAFCNTFDTVIATQCSYGSTAEFTADALQTVDNVTADIYLGCIRGNNPDFQTMETTVAWCKRMLDKFGVELEG